MLVIMGRSQSADNAFMFYLAPWYIISRYESVSLCLSVTFSKLKTVRFTAMVTNCKSHARSRTRRSALPSGVSSYKSQLTQIDPRDALRPAHRAVHKAGRSV